MKLDILAFGAHPDDVELGCGGTLAKAVSEGKKVGIIDLTQGEMATRGTPKLRAIESQTAAEILGVYFRENLNFKDAFIFNNENNQINVIKVIRKYQPKVILCNAIKDRHTDHAKASDLVRHACFLSGYNVLKHKTMMVVYKLHLGLFTFFITFNGMNLAQILWLTYLDFYKKR